jgi:hypothetical protein
MDLFSPGTDGFNFLKSMSAATFYPAGPAMPATDAQANDAHPAAKK